MAINPQILASVMQRMQPQGGTPGMNTPVPPAPPPGGQMQQQSPGMPVQMQGTMMMKPAVPPGGAPPMPQRRF